MVALCRRCFTESRFTESHVGLTSCSQLGVGSLQLGVGSPLVRSPRAAALEKINSIYAKSQSFETQLEKDLPVKRREEIRTEILEEENKALRAELDLRIGCEEELSQKLGDTSHYVSKLERELNDFLVGGTYTPDL